MAIIKVPVLGIDLQNFQTPMVSVKMSGSQNTTDATNTLVAFNSVEIDTDSAYDNTAGNYKFTVPSGKAGTYMINWMATTFNENSRTQTVQNYIKLNGSDLAYQRLRDESVYHRFMNTAVHWVGDLAVGDYIQFYCYHDVTSATPVLQGSAQSRATIVRLKTT
jgi:hypothetical protein